MGRRLATAWPLEASSRPPPRHSRRRCRCSRRIDADCPPLHRGRSARSGTSRPQDPADQGRLHRAVHRREARRQLALSPARRPSQIGAPTATMGSCGCSIRSTARRSSHRCDHTRSRRTSKSCSSARAGASSLRNATSVSPASSRNIGSTRSSRSSACWPTRRRCKVAPEARPEGVEKLLPTNLISADTTERNAGMLLRHPHPGTAASSGEPGYCSWGRSSQGVLIKVHGGRQGDPR
jgi:hypothetical protein